MKALRLASAGEKLSVLCLGAHCDDIEIGAGATLLSMIERGVRLEVQWCVSNGAGDREGEARISASDFLVGAADAKIELLMGHFASQQSKDWFCPEVFRGLARLRGMECRAPDNFAEAFFVRKIRLD